MIKAFVDGEKVTLQFDGGEMTFSEEELIAIFNKRRKDKKVDKTKIARKPTEGKYFNVNPASIDRRIFQEQRKNPKQEITRKTILKAFSRVDEDQERYGRPFRILRPERTWTVKTVIELKRFAEENGNHMADWVEQALEWAQRIANGETWKRICNEPDDAQWYRLVLWDNNKPTIVGGAKGIHDNSPAADVVNHECDYNGLLIYVIPSIVSYQ